MKEIELTKGYKALVDDEDYSKLNKHNWCVTSSESTCKYPYALTTINGKHIRMHRLIMEAPKHLLVDHKNGDTLDNRKENLRLCTVTNNQQNRKRRTNSESKYKGVYKIKDGRKKKWRARIKHIGKEIHLGHFYKEEDAYKSYVKASRELFGEFSAV